MRVNAETKRLGASTLADEPSRSARSLVGGRSQRLCFSGYGATKAVSTYSARMNRPGAGTFPRLRADEKGIPIHHFAIELCPMRALAPLVAILLLSPTTLGFAAEPGPTVGAKDNRECVVVLHGLARSSRSMSRLVERLSDAGFLVDSLDYPSTRDAFDELVASLSRAVEHDSASCPKIHFVTYSLGALLVRGYLQRTHPKGLGRVVMIGPPNHGSEIVDFIGGTWLFHAIFGPVGSELGTSPRSLPARLGPPNFDFGVIAGNQPINPLGWWLIPGDNDGEVSVESTLLENMSDFIVVPENHTFMMNAPEVAKETVAFLRTGHFDREVSAALAGLWFRP
jgi:triacylglycerol lipase